jgi:RNase adapter protein RapZ
MKIIIISGRSGSGKSISLHLLEDLGYYCIDNLPATMIPTLVAHLKESYKKIAIGIDARNLPHDLDNFHEIIDGFLKQSIDCRIIYLDAEDATLIKRFNETRRKHPLSNSKTSLAEAIHQEKVRLEPIAHLTDLMIDTSHYTIHQLRDVIKSRIHQHTHHLSLLIQSFGFKFGVPIDSDLVFDVRCLPNPYWHHELRPFTGKDDKIIEFLNASQETQVLFKDICEFLEKWIPTFEANNRSYMTISIGCTGGQHRSVYIAEQLVKRFNTLREGVQIRHRELL